jgi:hypothetical protein
MAFNPMEYVKAQNVPKQKTPNVVPGTGSLGKPGANPWNVAQGPLDAGPQGGGPSFGTADIARTFAPVMTKAATPGHWGDISTPSPETISADWEPTQVQAVGAQQTSDAEAQFQNALRKAFVDYGGDISKVGDWSKYIDAPTMEAARTNKYSAAAEALTAYQKALAKSRSSLAAKGMLSSGRTGLQTKAIMDAREKAEYAANRAFLGSAETGQQTIGALRQQIADKLAAANANAAARWAAAHPATWIEPTEAEYAPAPDYAPQPDYSHYTSPAAQRGLDQEQAYYVSRATPIPKPPPPPKPKPKPPMSFANLVGGRYR